MTKVTNGPGAKVVAFPESAAARLRIEGLQLIAYTYFWVDGTPVKPVGMYRPIASRWGGWYQVGGMDKKGRPWLERVTRTAALAGWRRRDGSWARLVPTAMAFPPKRRSSKIAGKKAKMANG